MDSCYVQTNFLQRYILNLIQNAENLAAFHFTKLYPQADEGNLKLRIAQRVCLAIACLLEKLLKCFQKSVLLIIVLEAHFPTNCSERLHH